MVKGETTAATSYGKTADQDQSFLGLPERYRRRPLVAEEMEFIEVSDVCERLTKPQIPLDPVHWGVGMREALGLQK